MMEGKSRKGRLLIIIIRECKIFLDIVLLDLGHPGYRSLYIRVCMGTAWGRLCTFRILTGVISTGDFSYSQLKSSEILQSQFLLSLLFTSMGKGKA